MPLPRHGFDNMPGPTRSVAISLAWRNALPERQRRRLLHPQSIVKRWRATQTNGKSGNGKSPAVDPQREALTAWRRFVLLVETLPVDQAAPLWREVQARADLGLSPDTGAGGNGFAHAVPTQQF
jgi:hypothetical protein